MTPDEIRELNRRIFEAFKPEGVFPHKYANFGHSRSTVPIGEEQFFWNLETGSFWSPATDLNEAVKMRPKEWELIISIHSNEQCSARLTIGQTWFSESPSAAVCRALLAWKEVK